MNGEVVLITGAAKGIGRFMAGTFARAGARLALADVQPLHTVAADLEPLGAKPLLLEADVSDEPSVEKMVGRTLDQYGQIDVLVNNAGIPTHAAWEPHW